MDLDHCVQDVLHMLQFRPRCEPDAEIRRGVACQDDTWTCRVDLVTRVADTADPRNICGCRTAAQNGVLVVLPETGGELQCHLVLVSKMEDGRHKEPYLAYSRIWHRRYCGSKRRIEYCQLSTADM